MLGPQLGDRPMVFSSASFLFFFLPLVLVIYFISPRAVKNAILLAVSIFFYLWGGGWFTSMLLLSITVNWGLGLWIDRYRVQPEDAANSKSDSRRNLGLAIAWIFNIGLLGYFKYANFLTEQVNGIAPQLFSNWDRIALPIGISFFTFQALSYVIDVAQGSTPVQKRWDRFALYVAFFPQLIAGPIVRYKDIANQIQRRSHSWSKVSQGMLRFSYGLVKKVVIADSIAQISEVTFTPGVPLSFSAAWLGLAAYTIQLYFDFSGYSDMAIGLGRIFGFRFPENFRRPYSAVSISDFWRRWHLTLSQWIRDYIYIPLGGSRQGTTLTYRNLAIAFLLTGIWHGANWTFILWGIYHGGWIILERWQGWSRKNLSLGKTIIYRSSTLLIVMLGWVIFRSETVADAWNYYQALGNINSDLSWSLALQDAWNRQAQFFLILGGIITLLPGTVNLGRYIDWSASPVAIGIRFAVAGLGFPLALLFTVSDQFSAFLYFQF
ncbi:MAG: MBOAT family protein [Cyanobacteria bacterium P01_D01_bin.73]